MANLPQLWFSHFRDLDQFRRDFDDLFDRMIGGERRPQMVASAASPALDSYVENGRLVVRADLPGIDPKEVEVSVIDNNLVIRAVRQNDHKNQNRAWVHREVSYGSFERSIPLPQGISADDVRASYRSGVLELSMPLPKIATGRKIPIQIDGAGNSNIDSGRTQPKFGEMNHPGSRATNAAESKSA